MRPSDDSLAHPLPAGMRDLLPEESRALSALGRGLMGSFELFGYQRVTVPVFEYAAVLERGLGALDPREVLRFVEPESGEVVALRPDMTPQIARLVATRLGDAPGPARLAYEGSVVRLRRERARRHRQIPQAGIELIGSAAPDGDFEVLEVACSALARAGLGQFVLDLGHARVAGALLEACPEPARWGLTEALTQKDSAELERRAKRAGLEAGLSRALSALTELCGGAEIWPEARRVLGAGPAGPGLHELEQVWERATRSQLAPAIVVDLGEVRDLGYYTGVTFQILAEGPGAAVGAGGRYDGLLGLFGAPRPAAGFAVALDHLSWALGESSARPAPRVLVSGDARVLPDLRALGVNATEAPREIWEHARAWHFSHVLTLGAGSARLERVVDRAGSDLPWAEPAALAASVAQALGKERNS
ncbi:MAG: ATP phosphoribosyltransferase regulatory subunit [Polyangiaceae bacterium]|nr:ATP phosphoribosyltransferase regulatory subunit [Polyangiaceae bacterium]